jgi:type IV pilus assembly protein PilY1
MLIVSYTFIPPTPIQYYGYFDPSARYTYNSNDFVRSATGEWSGNWLNWLCMRRVDVLRKVLMGGLATSSQGTGNQTNIGEAPDDSTCYYQKWFTNNLSGASSVSPYSGVRCYGIKDGYLYVGEGSTDADPYSGSAARYNIRVQKEEAYEPQDFASDHNLAGVLQRVGDKARWGNEFFNYGTGSNQSGGRIVSPIGTNMTSLITDLQNTHSNTLTPLAESYYVAMQYFKQEPLASGLDYSQNSLPNSGGDPWDGTKCAKSFVIMLNDGSPSVDRKIPEQYKNYSGTDVESSFANDEVDIVKDGEPTATACETYGYGFPNCGSDYLKDVALYARTNDLRADLDGEQNLLLYVVQAFGADAQGQQLLKDAARNGGFIDRNGNNRPDGTYTDPPEQRLEWDANGDGEPDTYYDATDGYELERQLMAAINDILRRATSGRAASGTAVSVLATTGEGEGTLVQAYFRPSTPEGLTEVKWTGYLQSLWVDTYGNLREDTDNDKSLDVHTDMMLSFYLDPESGESRVKRYDVSSNPYPDMATATPEYLTLENINPVWEAGKRLAYRDADTRRIYTSVDGNDFTEFTTANAGSIGPLLGVGCDSAWSYLGATYDNRVSNLIHFIRGIPDDSSSYDGDPVMRKRTISDQVWKLGDIVYSTPVSIAEPVENYGLLYDDASYQTFYEAYKNRETMVYVGANDGMLHAFTSGYYNAAVKKF